mgnify:CR=1 FL=1
MKETETKIKELDPSVSTLKKKCDTMAKELKVANDRLKDTDNRSRRHNIRIIGMPEQIEKPSAELYVEKWLTATVLWGIHLRSSR